jgi:hypothetical protein
MATIRIMRRLNMAEVYNATGSGQRVWIQNWETSSDRAHSPAGDASTLARRGRKLRQLKFNRSINPGMT